MMESPGYPPGSPLDVIDDAVCPCKGCGEILEEGKAFELAGNRWHIDCFRCNTCSTLLDSDANLLLLGDGSLICNNCTYSCNACGNKIEDLAILTGDQAFCAGCFRCRNCKRKIENLRYARTSQGIFCMSCHESLMARRRKKSRTQTKPPSGSSNSLALDKALPMPPPQDDDEEPSTANSHPPATATTTTTTTTNTKPARLGPPPRPPRPEVSRTGSGGVSSRSRGDASPNSANSPLAITPRNATYPVHSPTASQDQFQFQKPISNNTNHNSNANKAKSRQSMYSLVSEDNSEMVSNSDSRASYFPLLLDEGPPPPIPSTITHRNDVYAPRTIPPTQAVEIPPPQHPQYPQTPLESGALGLDSVHEKNSKRAIDNEAIRLREEQQRKEEKLEAEMAEAARKRELEAERKRELENERERQKQWEISRQVKEQENLKPTDKPKDLDHPNDMKKDVMVTDEIMISPGGLGIDVSPIPPPPTRPAPKGSISITSDNIVPSHARKPTNQVDNFKLQEVPRTKRATPKLPAEEEDELSPAEAEIPISFALDSRNDPLMASGLPSQDSKLASPADKSIDSQNEFVRSHQSSVSRKTNSETEVEAANSEIGGYTSSATSTTQASPGSHKKGQASVSSSTAPSRNPVHRPATSHGSGQSSFNLMNGSPVLPPFKSELNFEEEIGKIFNSNVDMSSPSIRRTSKSVKHGRSHSDMATRSSMLSPDLPEPLDPAAKEENTMLKNALRRSTQHVVELESKLNTSVEVKESLENDIKEKRTTVASLEADKEMAMVELSVLRERLVDVDVKSVNFDDFVAASLQEIASRINALKESHKEELESLIAKKNAAVEETATALRLRDEAIQDTEQLNLKNAQLADLNNELTRRIQGSFMKNKAAMQGSGFNIANITNGSANYVDGAELKHTSSNSGSTSTITTNIASDATTLHEEGGAVLAAPHVVNIRKPGGPAKKFNWKKGGVAVGKGVGKAFNRVFASDAMNDHHSDSPMTLQSQPFSSTAYGPPVQIVDTAGFKTNGFDHSQHGTPRGGLLKKLKVGNQPGRDDKEIAVPLLGSELEARVAYEGRRIPQIITKCLAEVENRGMDHEGIYRKGGGASQVRMIQETFDRGEDIDLDNPDIDITAVTSVLKQYFRKLPTPLVTFTIYDRLVDSTKITDFEKRKETVKDLINELPSLNRDILFFIINHLTKVAMYQQENLMNARNLAVVFAPSLMRDQTGEFELRDTHAKNEAIQFIIENAKPIFAGVNL